VNSEDVQICSGGAALYISAIPGVTTWTVIYKFEMYFKQNNGCHNNHIYR
jgi:hypothetical protein